MASRSPFLPDQEQVRRGEHDAIEQAVVFLEADPWYHGSGYEKEKLYRLLARHELAPDQQTRMDAVVLRLAHTGRREFVEALRFVHRRRGPCLKPALRDLLSSPDDAVAARALRMLLAARRPRLDAPQRERVRTLLEKQPLRRLGLADDELRRAVASVWSADWQSTLISAVPGSRLREVRLLALAPGVGIPPSDRARFVRPILRLLDDGDDGALRLIEAAWCPELEDGLYQLLDRAPWPIVNAVEAVLLRALGDPGRSLASGSATRGSRDLPADPG